jgi:hypothetical protein
MAFVLFAMSGVYFGCNTDGGPADCLECGVLERTDITISGNFEQHFFETSLESDASNDLITYNYYGDAAHKIDFKIKLGDQNDLIVSIYDEESPRPWEQVNKPFHMYPTQVLDDKLSYVTFEFLNPEGGVAYASNDDNINLPGITLGVFFVTQFDGVEIQCRIRDLNLLNTSNPDESILVNGTFVGAVTF